MVPSKPSSRRSAPPLGGPSARGPVVKCSPRILTDLTRARRLEWPSPRFPSSDLVRSALMIGSRRRFADLLAMTLLIVSSGQGCGDGKPYVDKSMNEATVSGIVKVRGKPAEGGTILFNA